MTALKICAPVRVDLAGGTLDIWPISSILENALTLNCTLNAGVSIRLEEISGDSILINEDTGVQERHPSTHADLKLLSATLDFFGVRIRNGLKITVKTSVPRGSGLGTSSVILAGLLHGIATLLAVPMSPLEIVRAGADIEARLIGCPTGVQDYIAPLFGGISAITFPAGHISVENIPMPEDFPDRTLLVYTGVSHFSGAPNWELVKFFFDNDTGHDTFSELADIASLSVKALQNGETNTLARLMRRDYNIRRDLPVKLLPETDDIFRFIEQSPLVTGFRMCGAAAGGTIVAITEPDARNALKEHLDTLGYYTLPLEPEERRITVESE